MISSSDIKSIANDVNTVEGILSAEESTKIVLSSCGSIFEKRLQAILFISEVEWIRQENRQAQITESTYDRTPRGVYSNNINSILHDLDNLYSRVAYEKGRKTQKFYCENVQEPKINTRKKNEACDLIEKVQREVQDISNDELMRYCRNIDCVSELGTGESIKLYNI